jgi:hypothetical protein
MMKDALKRRRGQGLDISIILGGEPMEHLAEGAERSEDGETENEKLEAMGLAPEIVDGDAPMGEVVEGEEDVALPPELMKTIHRGSLLSKFKK